LHTSPVSWLSGLAMVAALGASGCASHAITLPPPITIRVPGTPSATIPPTPPPPRAPRVALSTPELASVYAAALLAAESLALGREPVGALLLQELALRDTALEHALVRRHAVAGICEVTRPFTDVCTNDVRGFTATIVALSSAAVGDSVFLALVQVRPMVGPFDRTWLVDPLWLQWLMTLIRRDSIWVAVSAEP